MNIKDPHKGTTRSNHLPIISTMQKVLSSVIVIKLHEHMKDKGKQHQLLKDKAIRIQNVNRSIGLTMVKHMIQWSLHGSLNVALYKVNKLLKTFIENGIAENITNSTQNKTARNQKWQSVVIYIKIHCYCYFSAYV